MIWLNSNIYKESSNYFNSTFNTLSRVLSVSTRKKSKRERCSNFARKDPPRYPAGGCFSRLSSYAIRIPRGPRYAVIIRRFTGSSSEWRWGWEDFVKSFAHEMGRLSFSLRGPCFILSLRLNAKAIPPRALSERASPCHLRRRKLICLRLCQRIAKARRKEERETRYDKYEMG